jgi:hypothetical protein
MNTIFEGTFNLSKKRIVNTLEEGAKLYGGATKMNGTIYSNYDNTDIFELNDNMNRLGVIVPGTLDVDSKIDNSKFKNQVIKMLKGKLVEDVEVEGAWTMENGNVVIENNNMLLFDSTNIVEDLELLKGIAEYLKVAMSQEAISIIVNEGLVIY